MSDISISINNISKKYYIGNQRESYNRLSEFLIEGIKSPFRKVTRLLQGQISSVAGLEKAFWALRDVSIEINKGEIVGIIGRNGAGKSTLLKILSNITEPTKGYVDIYGRVGSLLEVGTGFHPELTGRENIFLNGAILGMKRAEIMSKFDDIVSFAGIDEFLDTPVKHYSSGMYVRLAFSVAAHLDPEILLVDEVLAVGDVEFQKKCLGKMDDITHEGRTILFVSHNMNAIKRLCPKCILLEKGRITQFGDSHEIVNTYLSSMNKDAEPNKEIGLIGVDRKGTGRAYFYSVLYRSGGSIDGFYAYSDSPIEFDIKIISKTALNIGSLAVTILDHNAMKLVNVDTITIGKTLELKEGMNNVRTTIEALHLNPGSYFVGLWLADPLGEVIDHITSAFSFQVINSKTEMFGQNPISNGIVTSKFKVETI